MTMVWLEGKPLSDIGNTVAKSKAPKANQRKKLAEISNSACSCSPTQHKIRKHMKQPPKRLWDQLHQMVVSEADSSVIEAEIPLKSCRRAMRSSCTKWLDPFEREECHDHSRRISK
ncbi:hypothetical protein NC652_015148 [Populus alba x Populus x berolinensis]|nr:hypothetical protein NC652_015148 [Populus alba x Populus x berolinensis]